MSFVVFQYAQIGIHAAQKCRLLFLSGFLRQNKCILFCYRILKIPLGTLGNVYPVRLDDSA